MKRATLLLAILVSIFLLTGLAVDWIDANLLREPAVSTLPGQIKASPASPPVLLGAHAAEPSASDLYARSLGFRTWNEYLANRPATKMGVYEIDIPSVDMPPVDTLVFDSGVGPVAGVGDFYGETPDVLNPTLVADLIVQAPPVWVEHSYVPPTNSPPLVTSVPEPGSLCLLLGGLLGILFTRRINQ